MERGGDLGIKHSFGVLRAFSSQGFFYFFFFKRFFSSDSLSCISCFLECSRHLPAGTSYIMPSKLLYEI
jgi:hypothetical protein